MEHYLEHIDYPIWEVIQKGNSPAQVSTDTNRQIRVLPLKTAEEILARKRERKVRTTLLMAIPEDHLEKFHKMTDAKEMTKPGVDTVSFDDIYNNLRVFESDIKESTGSSFSTQNVPFVSSDNTNSTNEVNIAYGISTSSGQNSQKEGSSSYTDDLMYSFFANQSSGPHLDHEDLKQVGEFNLEEMDLKWQVAMISTRLKQSKGNQDSRRRDARTTGYKARDNGKRPAKQDEHKAMVTIDEEGVDWSGHAEDDTEDYALMAFNSSNSGSDTEVTSCSKLCEESYAKLKKLYDEQREQLGDASIEIQAYTLALKKVEAQLVCHQKNQLAYEEKIRFMKMKLLEVFDSKSSDVEDSHVNDRFVKVKGMHAVPPTMIENYMPLKSDFGIDESKFTYGPKQSTTSKSDAKTIDLDSCESSSSEETLKIVPKPVESKPKVVNEPKVWSDAPIIEEYESDSDDEYVSKASVELNKGKNKVPCQRNDRSVWNNVQKLNHKNKFVPTTILTKTGRFPVNVARQKFSSQAASTSTARKVNTARPIVNEIRPDIMFSAVGGKRETAVKVSACCNWRYKRHCWNRVSKYNSGTKSRECVDIKDPLGIKAYLVDYQDFNGGPVLLENKVLFTDIECLVFSPDFKLPDENQVLLRVPRQHNMYNFNLENIVPSKGLACLIAKATVDESTKWHRRVTTPMFLVTKESNTRPPAEAVSTGCYVLNRVLVTKPQNKTPYELLTGKIPIISYIRPFGCHVTTLNTIDQLGKFEEKFDEGFLVGYSLSSKAFRVYNLETKRVGENLHINFLENKPNVAGKGPTWLFDLDYLTDSINYQPITAENKANKTAGPKETNNTADPKETNNSAGTQDSFDAENSKMKHDHAQEYYVLPLWSSYTSTVKSSKAKNRDGKLNEDTDSKTNEEPIDQEDQAFLEELEMLKRQEKRLMMQLKLLERFNDASTPLNTASTPTNQDDSQIPSLEDIYKVSRDGIFTSASYNDESAVADFINLVTTMNVYRNKKDERGVVVRNKVRFVAQGHRQEEMIDYDEVFAHVARIEAIRIFLAFAFYMGFIVYQMDVKSAFLYGKIDEEVGFIDKTLFINKDKKDIMLVQVYVDDIIFGFIKKSWCDEFEALMKNKFQMSSMSELNFFLRLQVKQKEDGIFISRDKYVAEILKKFDFLSVKIASTPIETKKPLVKDEKAADVTPKTSHLHAVNRIFRHLKSQPKLGLWCPRESAFDLKAYSDSDYAGANLDMKSTTGEAEYVAAASCCGQVIWIQNQMLDYGFNFMKIKIYIDNESTICIVKNPVFHSKTKHIEIRYHFIRDAYEKKLIQVLKIHTDDNVADLLTKAFDVSRNFVLLVQKLILLGLVCAAQRCFTMVMLIRLGKKMQFGLVFGALNGGHTSDRAEGALNLEELFSICDNLSNMVLALETVKDAQAAEIITLKARIKKLEKKCKPSISHHRAWLKSVQRLSMKKRFEKEYVSKQGRKRDKHEPTLDDSTFDSLDADLDADHGMDYIDTEEPVNEGRLSEETEELVSTARPEDSTVRPDVGTVDPIAPPTTTSIFDDEDITMDQTLIKMKEEKAKEKGVSIKDIEDSSRPVRSILTLNPLPTIDPKDKDKDVLEEPEHVKKMTKKLEMENEKRHKEEEASKAAIAKMYDEVQEGIEADELAAQRSSEIRSRPPTKSQLRNLMMTYLKNMGGCKHSQLKAKSLAEIHGLYERQKMVIDDFKLMDSDDAVDKEKVLEEPDSTKIEVKQEGYEESIRKRPGRRLKMKATKKSKRQKTDFDLKEEEHLKTFLQIVPDEEGEFDYEVLDKRFPIINWESKFYHLDRHGAECIYHRIFKSDGSYRWIKTFSEMVTRFDRMDLEELYNLMMQRFETTSPEGVDMQIDESESYDGSKKDLKELASSKQTALDQTATDDKDWKLIKEKFKELQCVWIHPPGVQEAQDEET
nr:hypothetical protein [Tanacetum cinerariifolium]